MRRVYVKPTVTIMHLRPEEKLALCDWPVGFMSSSGVCDKIMIEVSDPEWSILCTAKYDKAGQTGS